MNGNGWSCPTLPVCTRTDVLAAGQSYPAITVSVSIAAGAASSLTNTAVVSGGGSASASASDVTAISGPNQFAFTWTANPAGAGTVTPASGSLFTSGTSITVTATPAACFQFASFSGDLTGTANPASLVMDSTKNVVANFTSLANTNITPQMISQLSGFRYNRISNTYLQSLTVTNHGAAIGGPVYLAFDSLSSGAVLINSLGTTFCAAPSGSPYLFVSKTGMGAGETVTLSLQFNAPSGPPILFTPRYLAGNGLQ